MMKKKIMSKLTNLFIVKLYKNDLSHGMLHIDKKGELWIGGSNCNVALFKSRREAVNAVNRIKRKMEIKNYWFDSYSVKRLRTCYEKGD